MTESNTSTLFLLALNLAVFIAGITVIYTIKRLTSRIRSGSLRVGGFCVLALNATLLAIALTKISQLKNTPATTGVEGFLSSAAMGESIGRVIAPGLILLSIIWIYISIRAKFTRNSDSSELHRDNQKRLIDIGNRIATAIFWIVGGGFLVISALALIFGQ
ncbi:hypothetical protein [Marinobacter sp. R17]|uniref:hypothetical protein n=1 Tax=Marinobacter sp. R17 TaxID=2484250 RepID=UPI000F4CF787|nr:hypothetical protein [Marinobacter sp. R17]